MDINVKSETNIEHDSQKGILLIQKALDDNKGEDIVSYHLSNQSICDVTIVVTANNGIHANALMKSVLDDIERLPLDQKQLFQSNHQKSKKADQSDRWIVVDLNTVILHIVLQEVREFYNIDQLFSEKSDQVIYGI